MSGQEALQLAQFRLMAERQIEQLGRAIRSQRKKLGLSIPQLAAKLPVDPKTIERWELARSGGAMDNLSRIADALETTADDLLAASLEREPKPADLGQLTAPLSSADAEALRKMLDEVRDGQEELASMLAEVRDGQRRLLRLEEPGEPTEEATGS